MVNLHAHAHARTHTCFQMQLVKSMKNIVDLLTKGLLRELMYNSLVKIGLKALGMK
jgi:hypothetical protein